MLGQLTKRLSKKLIPAGAKAFGNIFVANLLRRLGVDSSRVGRKTQLGKIFRKEDLVKHKIASNLGLRKTTSNTASGISEHLPTFVDADNHIVDIDRLVGLLHSYVSPDNAENIQKKRNINTITNSGVHAVPIGDNYREITPLEEPGVDTESEDNVYPIFQNTRDDSRGPQLSEFKSNLEPSPDHDNSVRPININQPVNDRRDVIHDETRLPSRYIAKRRSILSSFGKGLNSFSSIMQANLMRRAGISSTYTGDKSYFGKKFRRADKIQSLLTKKYELRTSQSAQESSPKIANIDTNIGGLVDVVRDLLSITTRHYNLTRQKLMDHNRSDAERNQEDDLPYANDNEVITRERPIDFRDIDVMLSDFSSALSSAIDKLNSIEPGGAGSGNDIDLDLFGKKKRKGRARARGALRRNVPKGTLSKYSWVKKTDALDSSGSIRKGFEAVVKNGRTYGYRKMAQVGAEVASKETIMTAVRGAFTKPGVKKLFRAGGKKAGALGIAVEAGFILEKLSRGDWKGVVVDTTTSVLPVQMTRDLYIQLYGIEPENDPAISDRMPDISNAVVKQLTLLDQEEKNAPKSIHQLSNSGYLAAFNQTKPKSSPSAIVNPSNFNWGNKKSVAAFNQTKPKQPIVSNKTAVTTATKTTPNKTQESHSEQSNKTSPATQVQPMPPQPTVGVDINKGSASIEQIINNIIVSEESQNQIRGVQRPNQPTDNVPDPNYYNYSSMLDQMYFESAA